MSDKAHDEKIQFEALDALSGRSQRKLFSMSPNDVLVQISLPLVLILAIATRLMIIGQSMASLDRGPVILELWKQQLILRIDRVLDDWEEAAGIKAFPDFRRVLWGERRPDDAAFQVLCSRALELDDIEGMSRQLYRQALVYRPESANVGMDPDLAGFLNLYDPAFGVTFPGAEHVPDEFRIDDERRAFALQYIRERCRRWKDHVADLQWSALDRIAAEMKPNDPLMDSRLSAQMEKLANELRALGYPLLPDIAAEYKKTEAIP